MQVVATFQERAGRLWEDFCDETHCLAENVSLILEDPVTHEYLLYTTTNLFVWGRYSTIRNPLMWIAVGILSQELFGDVDYERKCLKAFTAMHLFVILDHLFGSGNDMYVYYLASSATKLAYFKLEDSKNLALLTAGEVGAMTMQKFFSLFFSGSV